MGLTNAPHTIPSRCSSCPLIVRFFFYFNYSPACVWKFFFTGEIIVFPEMIASLITCMFNFNLGFHVILQGLIKVQSSGSPQADSCSAMVFTEAWKGTIAHFIIIIIITLKHFKDTMEYSKCPRNCYHRKLQLYTSINNQNESMVWTGIVLRCISAH